jgi:predicted DsbA family dithiol-disulfide isomerase
LGQGPCPLESHRSNHRKFAKEYGNFTDYHHKIFKAVWEDDVDIEKVEALTQIAAEVGLNPIQFKNALNKEKYKDLVQNDFNKAHENQIWTIPSYVGNKGVIQVHHFKDMPNIERLKEII